MPDAVGRLPVVLLPVLAHAAPFSYRAMAVKFGNNFEQSARCSGGFEDGRDAEPLKHHCSENIYADSSVQPASATSHLEP